MRPEIIKPSPELDFLIEHYCILKSDETNNIYKDRFISNGLTAAVYNLNIGYVKYYSETSNILPPFFIVISKLRSIFIEIGLPADSFIVMFKTSALTRLFNLDLHINNSEPHININIFNDYSMWDSLKSFEDTKSRIDFFEKYVRENYPVRDYIPDEIDNIYNDILNTGGTKTITDILKNHELSNRTFRRYFQSRVGISAKVLSRIVRVNQLWQKISVGEIDDIQSVVFLGNFYDQPHLINDFKKIVGESPKSFFSRNLEELKFICGKEF